MSVTTKPTTLEERLRHLMAADDCSGALHGLGRRPLLGPDQQLSRFELDLRDWGFVFGLVFGLARCEEPCEPLKSVVERAFAAAVGEYAVWAGDIAPRDADTRAARRLLRALDQAQEQSETARPLMTNELADALSEFSNATGVS